MDILDVRTTFPPAPIGYLILVSGREGQAVAACKKAFEGLSKRERKQVARIEISFLRRPDEQYIVLAEVHCEHRGIKTSFAAGGAVPFKLGTSLEQSCLSAERVRLNMQELITKETWFDVLLRRLFST